MDLPVRSHLWSRLPLAGAALALALVVRLVGPAPPEPTEAGVAAMLGAAIGGTVEPGGFVWEPSSGLLDPYLGRRIVFLGAVDAEAPRDVYRARVRVSREGRPIAVRWVKNLTRTPLADERALVARGRYVAFVAHAFDAVQGLTVLDLEGGRLEAWAMVERLAEVGSPRGLGRSHVVFAEPPDAARIELRDGSLVMALGSPPRPASLRLDRIQLNTGGDDPFASQAWRQPPRQGSLGRAAASALALLDGQLPAALDRGAAGVRSEILALSAKIAGAGAETHAAPAARDASGGWPPAPIAPARPGEGAWQPAAPDWLRSSNAAEREPPFLQTAVRPDPERPYVLVQLLALDMRQLELGIEAGFAEPAPVTGPPGSGRVPAEARPRLVAAFQGTRLGGGMMVSRRSIVPLSDGAPTVAIDAFGRARLGTWSEENGPDVVAARQVPQMLLRGGEPAAPAGEERLAQRSGLCRTRGGHLVYGWSEAATTAALARAFALAGCDTALALAAGSDHGFSFLHGERHAPAVEDMKVDGRRFVDGSAGDFFYLLRRDPRPRTLGEWELDGGEQPPPAWLGAVHRSAAESLGVEVVLHAFAPERFAWQIRPGSREPAGETAPGALSPAEQARALVAIGLGVAFRRDNQRGLVLDGVVSLPVRPDLGLLASSPEGILSITRTVEDLAPPGDASELVLLAEAGEIRSEARKLGARRARSAACLLGDGTFVVALARADSAEPLALALSERGCRRIVELNRGRQARAFVHRAGSDTPPEASYEDTVLYGMAREATGGVLALP